MHTCVRVSLLAVVIFELSCGSGASLPDELKGSWGDTCCGGCERTFSFHSSSVGFAQSCPYTGSDSWEAEVAEVFLEDAQFRTTDDMWFAWHVDGNTLYFNKTNPGSERPVLDANWWSSADYVLTRR